MLKETFPKLFESIVSNDIYIGIFAIATLVAYLFTWWTAHSIKKEAKLWKKNPNRQFSKFLYHAVSKGYTLFVSFISIFPLLGMLGTVFGLLGLDLAAGDMTNIKNNFFIALTSTAWGIIFSILYKIILAFSADFIEEQIEVSKKLTNDVREDNKHFGTEE